MVFYIIYIIHYTYYFINFVIICTNYTGFYFKIRDLMRRMSG